MPIPLGIIAVAGAGAAGAAGAYDLLETTVLGSNTASVTFSSLGSYSDYKHLQIRATIRTARSINGDFHYIRFNSDTGSNYAYHELVGQGSSVASSASTSQTYIQYSRAPGTTNTANVFSSAVIDILDFNNSSKNTTIRSLSGYEAATDAISLFSGVWLSTAAVTSITLLQPSFNTLAGSRFSLYGIK
jgi:hypothetical protein